LPSINRLLSSAAKSYGEHLIAVILSGTGSDGAAGAREVKRAGGTVIIENPQTAAYPGMPASLAPTSVDLVVDLAHIGSLLQELVSGTTVAISPATEAEAATEEEEQQQRRAFQTILARLREYSGIDFAQYKRPTILRRLQRRMVAVSATTLADYAGYLAKHPDEYKLLATSFLINVTEFFRDAEIFAALRDRVLPELIAQARTHGNLLRFWSAGCATGEEVYSLAILVAEALGEELEQFTVQMFATDVDAEAIAFARRGIYPAEALAAVPEALRARYFSKLDGDYEVSKQLRGLVVFGLHDLGRQAPFPHVDLVLCRNVLIYFTPALQTRALQLFAVALHPGGYLMLGKAETVHPLEAYFAPADGQLKLYRRQGEHIVAPIVGDVNLAELAPPLVKPEPQAPRRPLAPHGVHGGARDLGAAAQTQAPLLLRPAPGTDEWLGSLVRGLPLGVVVVDRHYDIQAINGIALRLFGIYTAPLGEDLIHLTQSVPTTALRAAIDVAFHAGGRQRPRQPGQEEEELSVRATAPPRRW
ncbi:MAG TPA: CheR family methyltransferase, partial [Ktedonobacterales bacterium]|nr:CheR family methyltransferase [Ktedonobacterales bacterium]